jgi:hypothetical protein
MFLPGVLALVSASWLIGVGEARAGDPRVGSERCAECHKLEFKAWNASTHSILLSDSDDPKTLEKLDAIANRLGVDDIETDPKCAGCHFAYYMDEDDIEQVTSVDCESCHGAASRWVDVHSDYGSKGGAQIEQAEEEDPAHRAKRIKDAKAAGWLRPDQIVLVTQNCLQCHTGPGEEIVNVGEHPPGSDFELVSRLGGEVRHNFHRTNQGANAATTPERARQLYVVGRALELEYALRGIAESKQQGAYLDAMTKRVNDALGHLRAIAAKAASPELEAIIQAGAGVALKANNGAQANAAADRIQASASKFSDQHDGSDLGAIDSLIPKETKGVAFSGK